MFGWMSYYGPDEFVAVTEKMTVLNIVHQKNLLSLKYQRS